MDRINCVICESNSFNHVYTLENYPITPSSNTLEISSDEFNECLFVSCKNCGEVQLKTLVDPFKLYKDSHNSTENTPTWKEHHQLFAKFISENITISSILEVGGNSGILYKFLNNKITDYTILDICDTSDRPFEIKFIEGNCETFDFTNYTHIVLSHTFEHLYSPIKFIENLSKGQVKSVYISIPNMENLYNSKNISIIHNEHTFFVGDNEIRYLFSQYGFSCSMFHEFKKHSLFYNFVYDPSIKPLPLYKNMERSEYIQSYLKNFEESIAKVIIDKPCFICPAGHYGQKIYYYLQKYSKHIIGFIDNDLSKQNKRVYGTSSHVYSPDILLKYANTVISIILYAGPYTVEIKNQLNLLHDSIEYIII
jgi:hypothetical protein